MSAKNSESVYFKRSTLLVSDLEQSLKVYRDILGFEVFQIKDSDKDSFSYPVFKIPVEADIRFATLSSPSQVRTLGLTEVKGIRLPRLSSPIMSSLVIKVDNLEEKIAKIQSLGLETTGLKEDQGNDFSFLEQAFIDFDGHLTVLYQIID